ncbi:nucleotide exchange factor GrpE [Phytoactinopolyspora limicola]|uniref:nucleotide exchange factor GrpE n=1 Tax=Phytoactinopolyspora limicola TaxID=2715536 RepID=UPI001A9CB6ED
MDPETGLRREQPEPTAGAGGPPPSDDSDAVAAEGVAADGVAADGAAEALTQALAEAAERLDDLKRLQAEYTNYRRRVERDREAVREAVKVDVLSGFLGVLDDIGRAREHGDLNGAFRSVGEALEAAVAKAGLERFGEVGDEFDPTIHEALMHGYSDEVTVTTCTQVLQPGYRVGDRIVRPARVAVADPTEALPAAGTASAADAMPGPDQADVGLDTDAEAREDADRPDNGDN